MKYTYIACLCLITLNANAALTQWDNADIDTVVQQSQSLIDRTSGLKTRTENTLDEVQSISQNFRKSLGSITPELSDSIRNGLEDMNQILLMQREGLDDFLGTNTTPSVNSTTDFDFTPPSHRSSECQVFSPCDQFRTDLKNLLLQIKDLGNATVAINSNPAINLNMDLNQFIDLIDRVPGRALYPLYKVLVSGGTDFINNLPILFDEALLNIQQYSDFAANELNNVMSSPTNKEFPYRQYEVKGCQRVVDNYTELVWGQAGLSYAGIASKLLGKIFIAFGKTVLKEPDLSGGFAEFLDVEIELDNNWQDSLGNALDGLGDALANTSSSFENKIDYCASLRAQLNILDQQQEILDAINAIAPSGSVSTTSSSAQVNGGGGMMNPGILILLILLGVYRNHIHNSYRIN